MSTMTESPVQSDRRQTRRFVVKQLLPQVRFAKLAGETRRVCKPHQNKKQGQDPAALLYVLEFVRDA